MKEICIKMLSIIKVEHFNSSNVISLIMIHYFTSIQVLKFKSSVLLYIWDCICTIWDPRGGKSVDKCISIYLYVGIKVLCAAPATIFRRLLFEIKRNPPLASIFNMGFSVLTIYNYQICCIGFRTQRNELQS